VRFIGAAHRGCGLALLAAAAFGVPTSDAFYAHDDLFSAVAPKTPKLFPTAPSVVAGKCNDR
jgi:hypothetical protein